VVFGEFEVGVPATSIKKKKTKKPLFGFEVVFHQRHVVELTYNTMSPSIYFTAVSYNHIFHLFFPQ